MLTFTKLKLWRLKLTAIYLSLYLLLTRIDFDLGYCSSIGHNWPYEFFRLPEILSFDLLKTIISPSKIFYFCRISIQLQQWSQSISLINRIWSHSWSSFVSCGRCILWCRVSCLLDLVSLLGAQDSSPAKRRQQCAWSLHTMEVGR